jgi:SAM-dependent methyltransferase
MHGYQPATYGDRIADVYDSRTRHLDPTDAVKLLPDLAGDGPALELGIGTGRVALPLAAMGVQVHGIDTSEAMLAVLRTKDGGADVQVTIASFAEFQLERGYSLVYVAFNTLFCLESQAEQVQCFRSVARHLGRGGRFVLEAFVPDPARFQRYQNVGAGQMLLDEVELEVSRHDPVLQRVHSQRVVLSQSGIRLYPIEIRYAWPSELDLRGQLAGLELEARWSDWQKSPFDVKS